MIETIAGGGRSFSGDGGPALEAEFDGLTDAVAASDGTIYAADSRNGRIRRITPDGVVTTLAGPEGGLVEPTRLAISPDGELLAYDGGARRIWRMSAAGAVEQLLDLRLSRTAHLGADLGLAVGADGAIYIAAPDTNRVWRLDAKGEPAPFAGTGAPGMPEANGDGGPAVMATLNEPRDVAMSQDGLVYIAETGAARVRRVNTDGQIETYVSLARPTIPGLAVGDDGPFASGLLGWLGEVMPSSPIRVAAGAGFVDVLLKDELLSSLGVDIRIPGLLGPSSPVAPSQTLRVNDFSQSFAAGAVIRRFYDDGGSQALTGAQGRTPTSVATLPDGGALFVDSSDRMWRAPTAERGEDPSWGEPPTEIDELVAGLGPEGPAGDGGPDSEARLFTPREVVARRSGEIFIAEETRVRWIDRSGTIRALPGDLPNAHLAVDPKDNVYIAADGQLFRIRSNGLMDRIAELDRCESLESDCGDGGPLRDAKFFSVSSIAAGSDGTLYLLERGGRSPGVFENAAPLTPEKEQFVIIGFGGNNRVRTISPNGVVGTAIPTEQIVSDSPLIGPDTSGGILLLSSFQSNLWRIEGRQRQAVLGSAGYVDSAFHASPGGLLGAPDGTIYFSRDNTVRRLRPDGTINTIAGRVGRPGYSGDGGPAAEALLTDPAALALTRQGDLLIADPGAGAVRIVRDPASCDPVARPQIRLDGIRKVGLPSSRFAFGSNIIPISRFTPSLFADPSAPGSLISIYGDRLGPTPSAEVELASVDRLPTELGGVSVEIDGRRAGLLFASGGQINAVVPAETTSTDRTYLRVTVDGVASDESILEMQPSAPSVLAVLNEDGSPNQQSNSQPSSSEITVLVSGLGLAGVDPARIARDGREVPAEELRVEPIEGDWPVENISVRTVPGSPESVLAVRFSALLPVPAPLVGRSFRLRMGRGPTASFTVYLLNPQP